MFEEFEKYGNCLFKVRLHRFVPENYNDNIIKVTDEMLPQKEILCKIYLLILIIWKIDLVQNIGSR
ncbi:unnamed protein product [Meloidogyne enterolobii]|uniref:Uncharacterized protein n=1 Tax=Meloidogyne enterolobii TaxID=390850 RepID=A0ACB0ZTZ3_MELEN